MSTGKVAGVDLSVRARDNDFGVAYRGCITFRAGGDYTFYLSSDSGAHFRIQEATVMDDDFNHAGAEVSGTIPLAAGRHFRLLIRISPGSAWEKH